MENPKRQVQNKIFKKGIDQKVKDLLACFFKEGGIDWFKKEINLLVTTNECFWSKIIHDLEFCLKNSRDCFCNQVPLSDRKVNILLKIINKIKSKHNKDISLTVKNFFSTSKIFLKTKLEENSCWACGKQVEDFRNTLCFSCMETEKVFFKCLNCGATRDVEGIEQNYLVVAFPSCDCCEGKKNKDS